MSFSKRFSSQSFSLNSFTSQFIMEIQVVADLPQGLNHSLSAWHIGVYSESLCRCPSQLRHLCLMGCAPVCFTCSFLQNQNMVMKIWVVENTLKIHLPSALNTHVERVTLNAFKSIFSLYILGCNLLSFLTLSDLKLEFVTFCVQEIHTKKDCSRRKVIPFPVVLIKIHVMKHLNNKQAEQLWEKL